MNDLEREKMALSKIYEYARENGLNASKLADYEQAERMTMLKFPELFGLPSAMATTTPRMKFTVSPAGGGSLSDEFSAWAADRCHGMQITSARDVHAVGISEYLRSCGSEIREYVKVQYPAIWQAFSD